MSPSWPPRVEDTQTRVLLATMDLHASEGRVTIRGIAERVGCSVSVVHHHLKRLRGRGLVDWEKGTRGSLRPLVRRVA